MTTDRQKVTPPQIAKAWGIKKEKVIAWIRSGELKAINVATNANGARPRFLVDVEDLAAFELRRQVVPPSKPVKRKKRPSGVIEFFK